MTELAIPDAAPLELTDANRELAETYPGLDPTGDSMVDLLRENLGEVDTDLRFNDFDKIQLPPAGGEMWLIPDLVEGEVTSRDLTGVVVLWEASKGYWKSRQLSDSPPDCSSRDGRTPLAGGLYGEGGELEYENPPVAKTDRFGKPVLDPGTGAQVYENTCEGCPMNQWGSALDDEGNPTKGKACGDKRLLYMIRPGEVLPSIVPLPATSIAALRSFFVKLAGKRLPFHAVEITLNIKKTQGGPGGKINYGVVQPRMSRVLNADERKLSKFAADSFKAMFQAGRLDKQNAAATAPVAEEADQTAPSDS